MGDKENAKKKYIYGCGGVGRELAEYFIHDDRYHLMGFIVDNPEIRECMGFKIWALEEILEEKNSETINTVISMGEPAIRRLISEKVEKNGIKELSVDISSHFNPDFSCIGTGTILHKNSYVSVHACIGKSCLINKGTLVAHDCVIGDYSVLSPGVKLGGDVTVGENTYIGLGASVRNGITIGKNVIIGMG